MQQFKSDQIEPNFKKPRFNGFKGSWMAFQPPRRETGKEDQKTTYLFSGGQFKYPVGVILSISGEKSSFDETFSWVES